MEHTCEVRLLGEFGVIVDGRAVDGDSWRSRRAADLVKMLALQPNHYLHREQLMDALWPDLSAGAAAANLRKAVHYARRALGAEDALTGDGAMLSLWPQATVETDVEALLEASKSALSHHGSSEESAVVLKRFSFDLLPGDRYEHWVEEARSNLRVLNVSLLKQAGEWQQVVDHDPTDEEAHRALMHKHLESGNRREAIRQFELLREALREHIGVGPDPLTVELYEKVLDTEGPEPRSPRERAAILLANGLVAWSRQDLEEAERLAREARELSLSAELGHELGEASTLLGLIAYARGSWHELFRREFIESVNHPGELERAVFDAHLCFQEFYLHGPEGHSETEGFARELLEAATVAGSVAGQALATLLMGEFQLLSGDVATAVETLARAVELAQESDCSSATSIALERLAEAEVVRGNRDRARPLLQRALHAAEKSSIPSHLLVRILGVEVTAASSLIESLKAARNAERLLAESPRVCEPCSMNFRLEAARVFARAGDLPRARRQIEEADRITSLWQGGPWKAAVWEVRAELRRAEGEPAQAKALFLEAAGGFAQVRRSLDEMRCRAVAKSVDVDVQTARSVTTSR